MAIAVRMAGTDITEMDVAEIKEALGVANYPDDKDYDGGMIQLSYDKDATTGSHPYLINGFQTVEMVLDEYEGSAVGYLTKDVKGKPTAKFPVEFTASRFGFHTAEVPDTPMNRILIAAVMASDGTFTLSKKQDGNIDEIKKAEKEIRGRVAHAKEYAAKKSIEEVYLDMASMIDALKEKFGKGFDKSREYKEEIQPLVDALAGPLELEALRSTKTLKDIKKEFPIPGEKAKSKAKDKPAPQKEDVVTEK